MRSRKERKREMRKKLRVKRLKGLLTFSGCSFFALHSAAEAANAISAIDDAKAAGERMRSEAKTITEHRKAMEYASAVEKMIVETQKELDALEMNRLESETNLADAWTWVREAINDQLHVEVEARSAQDALKKMPTEAQLHEAVRAAETAYAAATQEEARQETRGSSARPQPHSRSEQELAQVTAQALTEINYEESLLHEAEEKVNHYIAAREVEGGDIAEPEESASLVQARLAAEAAESRLDEARERLEERLDLQADAAALQADERAATENYAQARSNLESAREYWQTVKEDIVAAQEDLRDLQTDLKDVQLQLAPVEESKGAEGQLRAFSWKDAAGREGTQVYMPYGFSVQQDEMEYGLQTGYVTSSNKSFRNGKTQGWTDTSLRVAKQNRKDEFTVTYGLDVNVPTGKSNVSASTVMPEDLVDGNLGAGWNFTPRLTVDHKIGEEDTWTFATDYSFKGAYEGVYEDDQELPGETNPGGEWGKSIEWLHAGQSWQMLASLSHSNYGKTQLGQTLYREGDQWDMAFYYNRVLSPRRELMTYYRYTIGNAAKYSSPVDWDNTEEDQRTQYYGLEWKYTLSPQRSLRLMLNAMQSSGHSYDPLTSLSVDGRRRYGGLIGYDYAVDENSRFSADVEQFYMKDGGGNSYRGVNVFLRYQKSF